MTDTYTTNLMVTKRQFKSASRYIKRGTNSSQLLNSLTTTDQHKRRDKCIWQSSERKSIACTMWHCNTALSTYDGTHESAIDWIFTKRWRSSTFELEFLTLTVTLHNSANSNIGEPLSPARQRTIAVHS